MFTVVTSGCVHAFRTVVPFHVHIGALEVLDLTLSLFAVKKREWIIQLLWVDVCSACDESR